MKQLRVKKKGGDGIQGDVRGQGYPRGKMFSRECFLLECVRVQFRDEKDIPTFVTLNYVLKVIEVMRCAYFSGNFGDRYFGTNDYC